MKKLRMLWKIIKFSYADRITLIYLLTLGFSAILIYLIDPAFKTIGNAIWYIYSVITTSGFGDIIPQTIIGKVITIIVGLFSLFMVALVTGVVVNFFTEFAKARRNESITQFIDQLEHLSELSKDELTEISQKVRNFKKNRK